ncbi:DUF5110 domain-containing protein [Sphingobacterium sp. SGG-5]|uniref:TIM-barrel domain-containing protein n=1 Tax=Sphingobacterium sp. SGG-5 TaxID=2710881 RepID=UPI0013EA66F7|nr:TIM-barrel domain-containing protein [Sphingobacterium sp. SGG-5]NGM62187.1 DUF5110 domain-containing protein [Sphingobacterium sp. SGG-5]
MYTLSQRALWACVFIVLFLGNPIRNQAQPNAPLKQKNPFSAVKSVQKINPTTVEVLFEDQSRALLDFYSDHIFRLFQDPRGGILRDPQATPPAQILVDNPRKPLTSLEVSSGDEAIIIRTEAVEVSILTKNGLLSVRNKNSGKTVLKWDEPIRFENGKTILTLQEEPDEYFYGGGVQNGRFSHKGKIIAIENQNSWTDGGVASPTPFYWSTNGYGVLWHTFKKGKYDFGATATGEVKLYHESDYLDVFVMINDGAVPLLNDFYQLTGNPILMPKFGFYEGHLNAYNRDYWKEDEKGILFEDGKKYKESQKDNSGIKESLNGEKDNYQFSARAVIDRYARYDMPLGWFLPNDGYGAGYGQTETLDGNIQNLKEFGDYARRRGVEIGLWTQSDLHPKDSIPALLQRDIVKEVRDAGVRVLKTDVAWVGPGYSFGLNGISDVGHIMPYYGHDARPFIISLDGWAGTQRYAGIWSGDQTGGVWEYIRFHIPTYIGSGLSGQPNISSDMDGIFGGKNVPVNVRDFQWKTFTPMQLNMDGWGSNPKYPHALGEPATSINRHYLKLKSMLMPYTYSIAREAVDGLPLVRAMFLSDPNDYTYGKATQYQFMYGPSFLVAPVYQATQIDTAGNDVRNGIYLPKGEWIDYFSGETYAGNRVINSFEAPLWKLPVFVKAGAIIPIAQAHNNVHALSRKERIYEIYPNGSSVFTAYDDDGTTQAYRDGQGSWTKIESEVNGSHVKVRVHPTKGSFAGMETVKTTSFVINMTKRPKKLSVKIGDKKVRLEETATLDELHQQENGYYYDEHPDLNRFATAGTPFSVIHINKTPQLHIRVQAVDITQYAIQLDIAGFEFSPINHLLHNRGVLQVPGNVQIPESDIQAYSLQPTWDVVPRADYYEIEFNSMLYSTIRDTTLLFDNLQSETAYTFKVRAVNKDGVSDWTSIQATTKSNPLEFALHGIVGEASAENQGGYGIQKLFDHDEGNLWHTKWKQQAVPFTIVMDLKSVNQLDKMHYLPRSGGGNGILTKGKVSYSTNKEDWSDAGDFTWERTDDVKIFTFEKHPTARYIKIVVEEGSGGFGSGRELYVFKVPGTESYLPGDINNDGLLDMNDFMSYTNYTGLRKGDADFEGYISHGDLNKNNWIDVYDISVLATQLGGGVKPDPTEKITGRITWIFSKPTVEAGETVDILVKGIGLKAVNAIGFTLPYAMSDYEFVGIQPLGTKHMENLTNNRLHTDGSRALYPTFVHIGNQETISGDVDLLKLTLKARKAMAVNLHLRDGFLVDKKLNTIRF